MEVVSIDLGSNSFRVLKYDGQNYKSIIDFEKTVGTADGLTKTSNISNEALQRIIVAINESIDVVKYDPIKAIAVTTQAMRVANNKKEIIAKIKEQTGVNFNIIDSQKEASLTLLAMQYALKREKISSDDFILLDIGGGSTELIIYQNKKVNIKSFSYGIVTLTQSKNKTEEFKGFKILIEDFIKNIDISESFFISIAGTPTTIAALKHGLDFETYDKNIVNGTVLTFNEIEDIQKQLQNLSKKQLEYKVGTGRDDYIDTGIEIYKLFFKILQKSNSIVFDDGLREGVAINYCLNKSL